MNNIKYGWWCICLHDYPEPEGIVWFDEKPIKGEKFKLPSSNFTEEWTVHSVNEEEMKFTCVK